MMLGLMLFIVAISTNISFKYLKYIPLPHVLFFTNQVQHRDSFFTKEGLFGHEFQEKLSRDRININSALGKSSFEGRIKAIKVSLVNSFSNLWLGNGAGTSQKLLPKMINDFEKANVRNIITGLAALGYNTLAHYPLAPEHDHLQDFHNHLVLQAAAYQNGTWIVGVAKAGREEDCDLIGGTCIIAPTGEIVAECKTLADEVIIAECDLERCKEIQENIFNYDLHRQPEDYALITAPKKESASNG